MRFRIPYQVNFTLEREEIAQEHVSDVRRKGCHREERDREREGERKRENRREKRGMEKR